MNLPSSSLLTRRKFILAASALPTLLNAQQADAGIELKRDFWSMPRSVWLQHQTTKEIIRETYWADGQLILPSYQKISWFLRDRHRNEGLYFNITMLDVLYATGGWLDYFNMGRPFVVTSAHRSQHTNARTEGAVFDSLHTKAAAIDGYIPGVALNQLASFGRWLRSGGVGYYPRRGFTHMDTGRERVWVG